MIDVLPRFPEAHLRMRVNGLGLGKEISILSPQAILSERRYPTHRRFVFEEADLHHIRYDSPTQAMNEIIMTNVREWLNADPLLWCQYGARVKLTRLATTYTITLYPYPR